MVEIPILSLVLQQQGGTKLSTAEKGWGGIWHCLFQGQWLQVYDKLNLMVSLTALITLSLVGQSLHCGCHGYSWKDPPHQCKDGCWSWGNTVVEKCFKKIHCPYNHTRYWTWSRLSLYIVPVSSSLSRREEMSAKLWYSDLWLSIIFLFNLRLSPFFISVGGQHSCLLLFCT